MGRSLELGKNGHKAGGLLDLSIALAFASRAEWLILAEAALGEHSRLTLEQARAATDWERAGTLTRARC
ncbi:MAG: hypothetical protein HY814_04605 [Candidatus Riflebacteria bacterium]|nr:hypothetical protein [Candidatus Riflebacteria bacterium]